MKPIYIADDSADQRYLLGYFLKRINTEYQILVFERAQPLIDSLSLLIDTDGGLRWSFFWIYKCQEWMVLKHSK